jgi:2-C-methyl-D-erythritol 2,4-cyclodiphosphate synthase
VTGRVGLGFDVHPFSPDPDRRLVLAGIAIAGRGLSGHSDADVIAHAVADALLGAAGLGDLGSRFPDDDPQWEGADSMQLLAGVVDEVRSRWRIGNVDCAVVLEVPRLAPQRAAMEARLSGVVGAPVSIKPKRAEGLGALGRAEGIACWAVAMVEPAGPGG